MDSYDISNDFVKIYQLHRDRIVHEDALIDRRMTWMLRLQATLFFLWGGLFAANVTVFSKTTTFHINYSFIKIVETLLCAIGFITALASWFTLRAVFDEIEHMRSLYEEAKRKFAYSAQPEEVIFGRVTGKPIHHDWGHIATKYAPWIFVGMWVILFFMFVARPEVVTQADSPVW